MPPYPSFCQFCGAPGPAARPEESASACASCGATTYLNSKPASCAVIVEGGQVLLVADAGGPAAGWDVPGGFLLYGEAPEEGLRREVGEELNAEVSVGRLLAVKLDTYGGPDEYTLNIFYRAELVTRELRAGAGVGGFGWFRLDALPPLKYKSTHEVLSQLASGPEGVPRR